MEGLAETLRVGGTCELQARVRAKGYLVTLLGRGGSEVQGEEPSVKTWGSAPDFPCFLFCDLGKLPFL